MSYGTCGNLRRFHLPTANFLGGCGQLIDTAGDLYRCADCGAPFHRRCLLMHFELDANTKALRSGDEPSFKDELLNSTYQYGEQIVTGAEILSTFRRHHTWRPEVVSE